MGSSTQFLLKKEEGRRKKEEGRGKKEEGEEGEEGEEREVFCDESKRDRVLLAQL
jgi:hypothetical protein